MLRQLSTRETSGRISGFGWAAGLLRQCRAVAGGLLRLHRPATGIPGLLGLPTADGQNVRAAMLLAAVWFALFAVPVLDRGATPPPPSSERRVADRLLRRLPQAVVGDRGEWRRDRNVVYYLLASAVFRDGLAGVFAFGAVLGVNVYGVSQADVLLFGVSASVVAAIGAVLGGLLDDRVGSKPVIVGALASMIAVASRCWRCRGRWRSGSAGCCCACSSALRSRRRAR